MGPPSEASDALTRSAAGGIGRADESRLGLDARVEGSEPGHGRDRPGADRDIRGRGTAIGRAEEANQEPLFLQAKRSMLLAGIEGEELDRACILGRA